MALSVQSKQNLLFGGANIKTAILTIILNNKGLRPKDILNILHKSLDENDHKATGAQVRHYLNVLKESNLIWKNPKDRKYRVVDIETAKREIKPIKTPKQQQHNNKIPKGKGWAALVLTINPYEYLTHEQIHLSISRFIDINPLTCRKWVNRLNRYLEVRPIKNVNHYRPKPKLIGTLMDLSADHKNYVLHNVLQNDGQQQNKPKPDIKPLDNDIAGTIHEPAQQNVKTQTAIRHKEVVKDNLTQIQFYDHNERPRVRLSRKCRRYELIEGHYEQVLNLFFSSRSVKIDNMGSWLQFRAKGIIQRETQLGKRRYLFYLHLKPNYLEIHLPPWEGYDPYRIDDEMEYIIDEVMEILRIQYGKPFTAPGKTDYANQELEHYDIIKGKWLLELGVHASNKLSWRTNPRIRKYADLSGVRYSNDKDTADLGATTPHSKALQLQSKVFHEELSNRTYEGVRDLQDRLTQLATREDIQGLTESIHLIADIIEGKGKVKHETIKDLDPWDKGAYQ